MCGFLLCITKRIGFCASPPSSTDPWKGGNKAVLCHEISGSIPGQAPGCGGPGGSRGGAPRVGQPGQVPASDTAARRLGSSPGAPDRSPKPRGDPGPEVGWRGRDGGGRADTERRGRRAPGAARGVRGGCGPVTAARAGAPQPCPPRCCCMALLSLPCRGSSSPALRLAAPLTPPHTPAQRGGGRRERDTQPSPRAAPGRTARQDTGGGRRAPGEPREGARKGGERWRGGRGAGPAGRGSGGGGGKEGTCGTGREGRGR